jgi:purine-binding chemotaxis protein CheW
LASTATDRRRRSRPAATIRLLLFAVRETVYGCDIAAVREIVPTRPATRLPGAAPWVRGLVNLRGAIATAVDLAVRLGAGEAAPDGSTILVELDGKQVGLAVDEVRDVQIVEPDRFEAATESMSRGGVVRGLGHLGDGVVIVLDVPALVREVVG